MNRAHIASRLFPFVLTALGSSLLLASPGHTAPAALTFNFSARVGYAASGQSRVPDQNVSAHVWLRDKQARVETSMGGQPSILLYNPPYFYRLLKSSKAGVRWKVKPKSNSLDPQELLKDPTKIRQVMLQNGAKRTGSGKIGSTPVEIYQADNFQEKGQKATVWLRKSDSLPLKLQTSGGSLRLTASWSNYQKPKSLAASLFAVPSGYKIRNASGQPNISLLN